MGFAGPVLSGPVLCGPVLNGPGLRGLIAGTGSGPGPRTNGPGLSGPVPGLNGPKWAQQKLCIYNFFFIEVREKNSNKDI